MDTTGLRDAYHRLLEAADEIATIDTQPAEGEWDADQILAHISIVTAVTISAAASVAAGLNTTYDNRIAQDTWTIRRVIDRSGGTEGLRRRIQRQAESLCVLLESTLGEAELGTALPTLLVSNDDLMVDGPMPLADIIGGLAAGELPGHTKQLLDLSKDGSDAVRDR